MAGHRHLPVRSRGAVAAALAGVVLLTAACGGGGHGDAGSAPPGGAEGASVGAREGGDVAAVDFTRFDGGKGAFADYAGEPLVVNFFASWCVPCVREMPEIERVHQELGDQVTFVGVDVRDRLAEGQELAARTGVTYELVRDPGGDVFTAFGGALLPTTA